MGKHYYNTNNLKKEELIKAEYNALSHEKRVILSFKATNKQTASDVWKSLNTASPITSIRRAMSSLCGNDKLEMLEEMKIGMYGSPEHYYKIIL